MEIFPIIGVERVFAEKKRCGTRSLDHCLAVDYVILQRLP